jgi:hypothetical protein
MGAATTVLLMALQGPCVAMTGNEFLAMYERNPTAAQNHLTGVVDGMTAVVVASHERGGNVATHAPHWCAVGTVSYRQYLDVALKGLRQFPEDRHAEAHLLFYLAFQAAWPCPARKQQTNP